MDLGVPLLLAVEPATAVYLVGLALSIGLAVASVALQKKGKRDPNVPIPTQVLQGGFIPRVIGRRRIAPIVGATGGRQVVKHKTGGGGKGKSTTTYTYREGGWHLLCVGPAYAIHRIWVDGTPAVWGGAITRDDTPSGSFVPVGPAGFGFYIYWGEAEQPISAGVTALTAEALQSTGVSSRFPYVCHAVWSAELGPTPVWPQIEYEIEVRPQPLSLTGEIREDAQTPFRLTDPDITFPGTEVATYFKETTFEVNETGTWSGTNVAPTTAPGTGSNIARIYSAPADYGVSSYSGDVTNVTVKLIGPSLQEVELLNQNSLGVIYYYDNEITPAGWTVLVGGFYINLDVAAVALDEVGTWTLRAEITSDFTTPPTHGEINFLNIEGLIDLLPPSSPSAPAGSWIEDGEQIGANPADAWYELATFPFPHGAGLDDTQFDATSFGTWHDQAISEVLPCNIYAANGELTEDTLAQVMSDHGVFLSYNPNPDCGHFVFPRLRDGSAAITIPSELNVGSLPEVDTPLLEQAFDRVMFAFQDKNREYRETVITVDEDGQASLLEIQKAVKSPIYTATDYVTARALAEVKSQEDLPGNSGYKMELNRDSWRLWPGLAITISAIDADLTDRLKIMEVQDEQLTTQSQISAVVDNYDLAVSAFTGSEPAAGVTTGEEPAADVAATFLEVPSVLLQTRLPRIIVLRVRDSDQIQGATVYTSPNGTTYTENQAIQDAAAGGTLNSDIAADDPYEIDLGPVITIQGDDIGNVEDLRSDEASWRAGRQVAVIGNEIFYVKFLRVISATTYRLEGLIRARLGTSRALHSSGAQVYVFNLADATDLSDPIFQPNASVYVKPAPFTGSGELSLASVTAINKTIRGNGIVPDPVKCLRVTAPNKGVPAYSTGEDITFEWAWSDFAVPGTGAGLQPAGSAVGSTPVYGTFEVRVYDTGDTLVATYDAGTTPSWTYDNGDLQTDLGSETDFYIEVRNINGGFRSEAVTKSITFLT